MIEVRDPGSEPPSVRNEWALIRAARLRTRAGTVLVWLTFGLAIGFAAYLAYFAAGSLVMVVQQAFGSERDLFAFLFLALLVVAAISFFFVPFLLALPLTLLLVALWLRPASIVLLRPFQRQQASRSLLSLVRRTLCGFGHVYTLSDVDIQTPWYIRLRVTLGQVTLFGFRVHVRSADGVRALEHAMERRLMRNLNWCMTPGKVFAVTCSDPWWQACIEQLVRRCQIVLLDVSGLKQNVLFELELCVKLGLVDRLILVCRDEDRSDRNRALEYLPAERASAIDTYLYDQAGRIAEPGFENAIARRIAAASARETKWARRQSMAWSALLLAALPLAGWYALPYLAPGWVARNSPFLGPIVTVYLNEANEQAGGLALGPIAWLTHASDSEDPEKNRSRQNTAHARQRIVREFGSSAVGALEAALSSQESSARRLAAQALGEINNARAQAALHKVIADPDHEVREAALSTLRRAGVDVVLLLVHRLSDATGPNLRPVVDALGANGDARASGALVRLLDHRDEQMRAAVLRALERCADEHAIAGILDRFPALLNDPFGMFDMQRVFQVRASSAHAPRLLKMLGETGDKDFFRRVTLEKALDAAVGPKDVGLLAEALSDKQVVVRRYAAQRLGNLGNGAAIPALKTALRIEADFFTQLDIERAIRRASGGNKGK